MWAWTHTVPTVVGVAAVSGRGGPVGELAHYLQRLGVGPEVLVAEAHQKFGEDGTLRDEATQKHVRELLERLVRWTERLRPK